MAINFTRLFTSAGKFVGGLDEVNDYRGATLDARVVALDARFNASFPDEGADLYTSRDSARSAMNGWVNYLTAALTDLVVAEVNADRPLVTKNLANALPELRRQMLLAGESLEESPLATAVTPTLTDGSAKLVATPNQSDGVAAQLALPDTYLVTVTRGFLGGDTAYQEFLGVKGLATVVPPTSQSWPGGSGVSGTMQVRDANANVGLTNGRMNTLTGWGAQSGGVWTAQAATLAPRSGYIADVFSFAPSGASGYIEQNITLRASTVYGWTLKVYKHTSGTQTWDVKASLEDSSGTLASTTTASSALSTGWNTLAGFFVTPAFVNGQAKFRVSYLNIVAGSNYETCHAGLSRDFTPLYPGGPTLAAWAGTKPLTTRDYWSVAATVGGTGELHRGIDRLLNVRSVLTNGLPVSGSATQADSLVS
jgi:hypothetical protein